MSWNFEKSEASKEDGWYGEPHSIYLHLPKTKTQTNRKGSRMRVTEWVSHHHSEEIFSDIQREPPVFQCLPTTCHQASLDERACLYSLCSLVSCVYAHWTFCSPAWTAHSLSLPLQDSCSSPFILFMVLYPVCPCLSCTGEWEMDIALPVCQNDRNSRNYKWDINAFDSEKFGLF